MMLDKSPEAVPIVPEQSVFDTRVFSVKKTPSNRPKCPSPPLKTPPVSRLFTTPRYTPAINNYTLSLVKEQTSKKGTPSVGAIPFSLNIAPDRGSSQKLDAHTSPPFNIALTSTTPLTSNNVSINSIGYETPLESYFDRHFRSLGEVGSGSFGHVYKAQSLSDNRVYAIKRSRHQFRGVGDRKRSLDEVKYASQLPHHPHILHYIYAWEEEGYLFIQTELCELGTLKDYMDRHIAPLEEDQIWSFLTDMMLGITHMHRHNLMHLDIKPANVFLTSQGHLKIGDFGLVQQRGGYDHDVEGDCRYMAPELLSEDKSRVGTPADIFCVGATAFEMAANVEMPSNGESWIALRRGHASAYIPANRSLELRALIVQLMDPVPDRRPSADQVIKHTRIQRILRDRERGINLLPLTPTFIHQNLAMDPTPPNDGNIHTPPLTASRLRFLEPTPLLSIGSQQYTPVSSHASSATPALPSRLHLSLSPVADYPTLTSPRALTFASPSPPDSPSSLSKDVSFETCSDSADEATSIFDDNDFSGSSSMNPTPPMSPSVVTAYVRELETKERGNLRRESLEATTRYASSSGAASLLIPPTPTPTFIKHRTPLSTQTKHNVPTNSDNTSARAVPAHAEEQVPLGIVPKKLIDMFNFSAESDSDMED